MPLAPSRTPSSFFDGRHATVALVIATIACRNGREKRSAPFTTSTAPAPNDAGGPRTSYVTRRASFAVADITVAVEDVHMSTRLDLALERTSSEVVVNGGFFGSNGQPIGLAASSGHILGTFAPDLSGGVLTIREGRARLMASEEYKDEPALFAIQCRPRLVVGSRVNIRSDDGRRAPRTALCIKNAGRDIELVVAGLEGREEPTLHELAVELSEEGCEEALNLDGGPSSGWASREGDGGLTFDSPRAPVRHVVTVRRSAPASRSR